MNWEKYSNKEIKERVFGALDTNIRFGQSEIMGLPISTLDPNVFDSTAAAEAPFLRSMMENSNHHGCPTMGIHGDFFQGTEELELEAVRICAEEIMMGKPNMQDGYVASGGTECNIHALWIYKNLFKRKYGASSDEIGLLFSEDTHYSIAKAANVLNLRSIVLGVDEYTRQINGLDLIEKLAWAKEEGIKYFVFIANMGTTMFGSVDDIDRITLLLDNEEVYYKVHVDAAFGGFIYPFVKTDNNLNFSNKKITSISMDAHKMLRTPYGTGIFMIRKGYLDYLSVKEPKFMANKVYTLSGSRAGSNAVSIWMTLHGYGSKGLIEAADKIMRRKAMLCKVLDERNIKYYHNEHMNIVTIQNKEVDYTLMEQYGLVPDDHDNPKWWKVVLMDHVDDSLIEQFLDFDSL